MPAAAQASRTASAAVAAVVSTSAISEPASGGVSNAARPCVRTDQPAGTTKVWPSGVVRGESAAAVPATDAAGGGVSARANAADRTSGNAASSSRVFIGFSV